MGVENNRWYPLYHVAAPVGWINDPNGFCVYKGKYHHKGKYHLFYQYHPYSPQWGPMHWGHVVSDDLARWEHLPIALAPSADYDKDGCFSGSAIEKDGKLYLLYTGNVSLPEGGVQLQCLAVSNDGVYFEKYAGNPIIIAPQSDAIHGGDFRDPKVWEHDGKYYCVIGSRTADGKHGQALIYESEDLKHWAFKSIATRSKGNEGTMWECPNFCEVDGHDVLVMSPMGIQTEGNKFVNAVDSGYMIGTLNYNTGIFTRGKFYLIDYGSDFYAPQVTQTEDGRCIMIGWLAMWYADMPEQEDGWAGTMSVPRELHVRNGKLLTPPVKEMESLRESAVSHTNLNISVPTKLDGVHGITGELIAEIDTNRSEDFSIAIRVSETERTLLSYYKATSIFSISRENSGKGPKDDREVVLAHEEILKLRIYLDRSSVEVFINDGAAVLSARIYPKEKSQDIAFIPHYGKLALNEVTFYKLNPAIAQ